ncbi:hypothetical protein [Paenibacillus glycanilyticus]|nr:hypothetical protein [Paenibacillus glycanilyticus]
MGQPLSWFSELQSSLTMRDRRLSGAEWLCSRLFACYRPVGPARLVPNGPAAGILPAADLLAPPVWRRMVL